MLNYTVKDRDLILLWVKRYEKIHNNHNMQYQDWLINTNQLKGEHKLDMNNNEYNEEIYPGV